MAQSLQITVVETNSSPSVVDRKFDYVWTGGDPEFSEEQRAEISEMCLGPFWTIEREAHLLRSWGFPVEIVRA